jgi:multidrug efflux pump subunit AcrA (membrane-fusion protein)
MRSWTARALGVLLVLGLAAGAWWRLLGPLAVEVAPPARGPAVEAVYGPGTVEPVVMLPIGPKVTGRLERLVADEGDAVRAGQVLAELDNRELAASVVEWQARVRYGEAQFRRASELFRNRTGPEAALERARQQLAEMTLTAPADGVVVRRDGEIGQLIAPGETIFWLSCCEALRVTAEIDEEDIAAVRPGQRVLIRADAFPERVFEGRVDEITPKGDPVARSFRVRIGLPSGTPLMIGMTADCNIIFEDRQDALLVPATAIADGGVWVVEDGALARRRVALGVTGERLVEVTSGIDETDLVVARPGRGFREGRRVRIVRPDGS